MYSNETRNGLELNFPCPFRLQERALTTTLADKEEEDEASQQPPPSRTLYSNCGHRRIASIASLA